MITVKHSTCVRCGARIFQTQDGRWFATGYGGDNRQWCPAAGAGAGARRQHVAAQREGR